MTDIRALAKAAIAARLAYKKAIDGPTQQTLRDALQDLNRALSPERALAMQDALDAADALHVWTSDIHPNAKEYRNKYVEARARLEAIR